MKIDFLKNIIWYYATEVRHCFTVGAASGVALMLAAGVLLVFVTLSPLLKGLAIALLIGGLLFFLGGLFAGRSAQKSQPEKIESYKKDQKKFISEEYSKVEKIHKSWLGIRIFWSLFLVAGVGLLIATSQSLLIGIAIGALIIGTLGHIEEAISYQHNERYRREVTQEHGRLDHKF